MGVMSIMLMVIITRSSMAMLVLMLALPVANNCYDLLEEERRRRWRSTSKGWKSEGMCVLASTASSTQAGVAILGCVQ